MHRALQTPLLALILLASSTLHAQTPATLPAKPAPTAAQAQFKLIAALYRRDPHDLLISAVELGNAKISEALSEKMAQRMQRDLPAMIPLDQRDHYLDKPALLTINPAHFRGDPVYYINGIATPQTLAVDEATALANTLKRPVNLLYNPASLDDSWHLNPPIKIAADLAAAAYDRTWPFQPHGNQPLAQKDPVTRQLTSILLNSPGNITIISHSQGCLITRNALLTANHLAAGNIASRISWIATGIPLRDEEIYPKPAHIHLLANPQDPVPQCLGLRLDPNHLDQQSLDAHDFLKAYLPQITPDILK